MIKGLIYQEDIAVLNVHAQICKICESKTDRTKRRNRQPTITAGDFIIPLSTDRKNNETESL